jgi:deazaflavin-dependent oxidoreductase (nitroreductase family)
VTPKVVTLAGGEPSYEVRPHPGRPLEQKGHGTMTVRFDQQPMSDQQPMPDEAQEPATEFSRPSRFARIVMRPMTKVLNPLIRRMAGRRHFNMAARIYHRGRRSGREYVTPATARLSGEHFWVSLTFGANSDWCRNVRAAGECTVRWQGRDYHAVRPVVVDRPVALAAAGKAFKRSEKAMMKAIGVKQFLRLDVDQAV